MADATGYRDSRSLPAWERFRQRVAELGGVVLEPKWLGNHKPHRCRCVEGHECRPSPINAQKHGICRVCAGNDTATARDNFYRRVADLGGVVLEPEWLGNHKPHLCRCAKGHECRPMPKSVQKGQGICRVCAGHDSEAAWDNFRKRIAELGGAVLEPEWLGARTPHRCLCASGHECWTYPNNIQSGQGNCRICADRDNPVTAQRKMAARDDFYQRVADLGGVVLEPEWLGVEKPHRCMCVEGHECRPMPKSIQRGQGMCQVCSWRGQDALYVVRNPARCWVKFGITSRDGAVRLRRHRSDGFINIIRLEKRLPEYLAAHIEQKIKAALQMAGAKPVQGYEYFSDENTALILNEINIWMP